MTFLRFFIFIYSYNRKSRFDALFQKPFRYFLSNFDFIDYVSEVNSPSAIEAIRQIKPDFYSNNGEPD